MTPPGRTEVDKEDEWRFPRERSFQRGSMSGSQLVTVGELVGGSPRGTAGEMNGE